MAHTLSYPYACRRLLRAAMEHKKCSDGNEGMAFFGESVVGLVALDMTLTALRILGVNDDFARAQLDDSKWIELDNLWGRARRLRNAFVYFDQRIEAMEAPSLVIDGVGIHAASGPQLSFSEWQEWLDAAESVGRAVLAHRQTDRSRPSSQPARSPASIPLPEVPVTHADPKMPAQAGIWFAVSHIDSSHSLVGRAATFRSIDAVSMTAHFCKASPGPVELRVQPPSGPVRTIQRWAVQSGRQLVTIRITGLGEPGPYDVSVVDGEDPTRVLALGRFRIDVEPERT